MCVVDSRRGPATVAPRVVGTGRVGPRTGYAPVAELVDALDSGSSGRKLVEVRVLSGALK